MRSARSWRRCDRWRRDSGGGWQARAGGRWPEADTRRARPVVTEAVRRDKVRSAVAEAGTACEADRREGLGAAMAMRRGGLSVVEHRDIICRLASGGRWVKI